jgi:CheY-like chemotaxis protein
VSDGSAAEPAAQQASAGETATLIDTARRFAELQRGTLDVHSSPIGSLGFTLDLPVTSTRTVLVIDDNPDLAELFRTYLTGTRYRAVQARTVPLALRLASELHPDIITLDVLMPSQDGWQILQLLRANPALRDVPIVVCSIVPERPLAISLGADAFLTKPVTAQSLLSTLESCLKEPPPAANQGSPADSQPAPRQSTHQSE